MVAAGRAWGALRVAEGGDVITDLCQRWRRRCARYRPAGEVVDVSRYEVAAIPDDRTARAFVEEHHYSGSYPAARRRFGLYERGALVGVAVYSVPPRAEVLSVLGCPTAEGAELGRFVLLDRVPGNGETFFLSRCHALLRREGFAGVVSFSDPHPRTTSTGEVIFAGHLGGIYQASSAVYLGAARANVVLRLPDGRTFSRRALAKIRARDRGWRYAVEQLVAAGVRAPEGDDLDAWLAAEALPALRRDRHPGCLKYAIPLHRACARVLPASLPYPRIAIPACAPMTAGTTRGGDGR